MINRNLLLSKAVALDIKMPDLAERIGVNPSTLSQKMNGKREFTVAEVNAVRNVLRLTQQELIDIFFN